MPRSTLLGRPRTFVADIIRDDQGRAVRIEGRLDGGWTDDDVASALVVDEDDRDRCSGCSHRLSESTDPDNQFEFDAVPIRCHACAAAARATSEFEGSGRAGLMVRTSLPDDR